MTIIETPFCKVLSTTVSKLVTYLWRHWYRSIPRIISEVLPVIHTIQKNDFLNLLFILNSLILRWSAVVNKRGILLWYSGQTFWLLRFHKRSKNLLFSYVLRGYLKITITNYKVPVLGPMGLGEILVSACRIKCNRKKKHSRWLFQHTQSSTTQ